MLSRRIYICIVFCLAIMSCEPIEIPVEAIPPGEISQASINIESDYKYQKHFSLDQGEVVHEVLKTDWDIAFSTNNDEPYIILNSSKAMQAALMVDRSDKVETGEVEWSWDTSTGNTDTLALKEWQLHEGAFLVDRGYDPMGQSIGYVVVVFEGYEDGVYKFSWNHLDNEEHYSVTIKTNESIRFQGFSFSSNEEVEIEPERSSWDILATQYLHVFNWEEASYYLVSGILINQDRIEVFEDEISAFVDINREHAEKQSYSREKDIIGYDWKTYDYDSGFFIIDFEKTFLLKTSEGLYYKLRFIDFYDENGIKGTPKFEYQKL